MDKINVIFDRMDAWRHFPNYQLERRADIFFALYLPEVLEAKLGFPVRPELVPEFPVRIGTIYPDTPTSKSYKIDYLALSVDSDKAILVELKTEGLSLRREQDEYLRAAQNAGLIRLLEGLLDIFRATNSKRKYFCLLEQLGSMGLLRVPAQMTEIMSRPSLQGVNEASRQVEVTAQARETIVIYVQPNGTGSAIVSFSDFANIVRRHDDPVSLRFAASLHEWAAVRAGGRSANNRGERAQTGRTAGG